jgi:bifunctional non-homologous end joining protein LigD
VASRKLSTYRAKRDFEQTREPSGEKKIRAAELPRYVIQKHAARRLHYDLRLEHGGVFKSWAVTKGPSPDPRDKRLAVEVEDHPLDYGDFEGTIPQGQYGGGTVMVWDRGYWLPEGERSVEEQLRRGELKVVLYGERLKGRWVLVRMRTDDRGKRNNWLLIAHGRQDREADRLPEDRSVASGRNMAQIAAGKGRAPKPFVRAKRRPAPPDAVWNSNRAEAATPKKRASARGASTLAPRAAAKSAQLSVSRSEPSRNGRRTGGRAKRSSRKGAGRKSPRKKVSALPDFIPPQLCVLQKQPPPGPGWGHEVKLDGYRMQLRIEAGAATLKTRKGLDWTAKFPEIAAAAGALPDAIVDGEVVALDSSGVPDFAALQAALSAGDTARLVFFAFDLLFSDQDLRPEPLTTRKERLRELLHDQDEAALLRYVEHFEKDGESVLASACRMQLEGIISKRLDASYVSDRTSAWIKSKCRAGHEVVIGGYTTEGARFRSLLVGVNRDGRLAYVGRVGTGFSGEKLSTLVPQLQRLGTRNSPFEGENAPRQRHDVHWVKPELVAEIEFAGWTGGGQVRQAAFKGLRQDKPAREVTAENPAPVGETDMKKPAASSGSQKRKPAAAGRKPAAAHTAPGGNPNARTASAAKVLGVAISKPDKALWPDGGPTDGNARPVTKLDLARYFESVAGWMLTHLEGRPCSLVRYPDGIHGGKFFQRHAMRGTSPHLTLAKVPGEREPYLQIDRAEGLIAVAQSGALELHPWNCHPGRIEVPGRLVFDLDPAPDVPFHEVVAAAREMKERLEALGLVTFCKTTGGKGLHVVTPLAQPKSRPLTWAEAKTFAMEVCRRMAVDHPDRYLINMAKKQRVGRIFLDYLRNDRMATAVAPLSPRAREGAPVSMPLTWAQVRADLDPSRYTLRTVPALLKRTAAWKEYCDSERPLGPAVKRLLAVRAA